MKKLRLSKRARIQTQVCLKACEFNHHAALVTQSKGNRAKARTASEGGGILVTTEQSTQGPGRMSEGSLLLGGFHSGGKAGTLFL